MSMGHAEAPPLFYQPNPTKTGEKHVAQVITEPPVLQGNKPTLLNNMYEKR